MRWTTFDTVMVFRLKQILRISNILVEFNILMENAKTVYQLIWAHHLITVMKQFHRSLIIILFFLFINYI